MQQVIGRRCAPEYLEKIVLYFSPDGCVEIVMGNQRIRARGAEVEKLISNRLVQHALYAELFERSVLEREDGNV